MGKCAEQMGKCAATAMVQSPDRHNRYANRLAVGLSCRQESMSAVTIRALDDVEGMKVTFSLMDSYQEDHKCPEDLREFRRNLEFVLRLSRSSRTTEREYNSMGSISLRMKLANVRDTMYSMLGEGKSPSPSAVEDVLEKRLGDFMKYLLGQALDSTEMDQLLDCIDVEVTTQRKEITERSLIILMFNQQSTFPIEQIRLWVIQLSAMMAIRSKNPIHDRLHWCILTNYDILDCSPS